MIALRITKKFRQILTKHQKFRIVELIILMVIGGFMEMLSVSLIIPFMDAIINPESTMEKSYVKLVCGLFGVEDSRMFLIIMALLVAVIYIIKNVYLIIQMTIQARFVRNNMFMTQRNLLHNILSRPYEFFLDVKSGEIIRIVGADTGNAYSLLTSLISLVAELIVSGMLLITVVVISPFITISMGFILIGMVLFITKITRPLLKKSGELQQAVGAKMNMWLLQSIQGIKELKIMDKREYFEQNYAENGKIHAKNTYQKQILGIIPRFIIEACAMSSFFLVVAFMIYSGVEIESIIPMLTSIAVASIRLLPSVNRISQSMADMAFNEPMLDKLIENLQEASFYDTEYNNLSKIENDPSMKIRKLKDVIEFQNVCYKYPQSKKDVLSHANMVVRSGMSVGIIGSSGAGKTTAVDILLGLLIPQSGDILIDGVSINEDKKGWLSNIGYIPQTIFLLDATIKENVAFGMNICEIDDSQVWSALRDAAMEDYVRTLPDGIDTQIGERGIRLSGGQRQRIGIARALYNDPTVLFFDEATSALDNATENEIMDSIRRLHGKKTMIIVAHRLSTIEHCDIVYKVVNGKIEAV